MLIGLSLAGVDPVAENVWVVVDSDGEEDASGTLGPAALKENDLVAFMNQLPFAELFARVLGVAGTGAADISPLPQEHVLRLFAFSGVLVELLDQGLKTYGPHMHRYDNCHRKPFQAYGPMVVNRWSGSCN